MHASNKKAVLNRTSEKDYFSEDSVSENTERHLGDTDNIDDFLSFWLANRLLDLPHQEVFDKYSWSYRRHFGKRIRMVPSELIKVAVGRVRRL